MAAGAAGESSGSATAGAESLPPVARLPVSQATGDAGLETTGRFIVILKEGASAQPASIRSSLKDVAGLKSLLSTEFKDSPQEATAQKSDAVIFKALGIVLVPDIDAATALAASTSDADSPVQVIEPEYIAYLSDITGSSLDYLRGYRDAVNHLYDQLTAGGRAQTEADISAVFQDTDQFTWGLQAVRAHSSARTGNGIKVAVLDTGIDLQHPDYAGRAIMSESFVPGVTVQDIHGHGTHCIGTACGPARPSSGVRRYGVASGAQIFAGKVFNNAARPSAATGNVIAGIEWAVTNGCRIISMSLGVPINQKILQYETPIRRALEAGTLIVAAAGNNANRPTMAGFVEPPANADASLAVAAVDSRLQIARFSARSSQVTGVGGIVNVSAPGVAVFSSLPTMVGGHGLFNGTSMATPHVAGVAALWAEATGEAGQALWNRVIQSVRPLSVPSVDVGSGLVQAPQ
jgi:subtilisin family serine protease